MTTPVTMPQAISDDLEAGRLVGEYRVVEKVGQGGFGSVYRARHPVIGKDAAVKVLSLAHSRREDHVSRFMAEARAVNQIGHPNIVDIFSFGRIEEDGRQYFVMEFVEGETLEALVSRRGGLPPREAIPVLRAVAKALQAAHDQDILHRDLKPANVLVGESDGEPVVKLIDFGIAKLLDQDVQHKTRTGTPIGTPQTMSPEQCLSRALDPRSDVYAFGCLCFFVLTGRMPFAGESQMDLMMMHMSEPAPAPSSLAPRLGGEVDRAVLAMLEKDPGDRPRRVLDAVNDLAHALEHPSSVGTRTPDATLSAPPPPPSPKWRPRAVLPYALGAVLVGAGAIVAWRMSSVPEGRRVEWTAPTAAPSEAVPPTGSVELRFRSDPPAAEVWIADERVGTTDAPLTLKRRSQPVRLSFRAKGWVPLDREITPLRDAVIDVQLSPLVTAPPSPAPRTRPAPAPAPPPSPPMPKASRDELAF